MLYNSPVKDWLPYHPSDLIDIRHSVRYWRPSGGKSEHTISIAGDLTLW